MPIVLYGLTFSPPCVAVLSTAKAIGIDIELQNVDLLKGENKTETYQSINPAHSIPALDDDGFRIWESRAIITYLISQYGSNDKLYPKDVKKRAKVDNILYFDATSLYTSFANYIYPHAFEGKPLDAAAKAKVDDRLAILDFILSKNDFLAGDDLTAADISVRSSFVTPTAFGISIDDHPNITKWMAAVDKELPFLKDAVNEGITKLRAIFDEQRSKSA